VGYLGGGEDRRGFAPTTPASPHPTEYAHNLPIVVYAVPPDDEQIVVETCTGC
jgi:hypothetical protein